MRKIKRSLSVMLVMAILLSLCCIQPVFAAEESQPNYEQSKFYSFDGLSALPQGFSNDSGSGDGSMVISDGAIKVTTNKTKTTYLAINLWGSEAADMFARAKEKGGILTYSFDWKTTDAAQSALWLESYGHGSGGYRVADLLPADMAIYKQNNGGEKQWISSGSQGNYSKIILKYNFSTNKATYKKGDAAEKTLNFSDHGKCSTVGCASCKDFVNVNKFIFNFRTYCGSTTENSHTYYIDNFKAEYTERYTSENITLCKNFINVINTNGTAQSFKDTLAAAAPIIEAVGYTGAKSIAENSIDVTELIKDALYSTAPYQINTDEKVWESIGAIMGVIDTLEVPLLSINSADTAEKTEQSLLSYYADYEITAER